jgi:hypothetical protein
LVHDIGLNQSDVHHQLRIRETCTNPLADSNWTYTPLFYFVSVDAWFVHVGSSGGYVSEVNALAVSSECSVVREDQSQEFSLCFNSNASQWVTVVRTDRPDGWSQQL